MNHDFSSLDESDRRLHDCLRQTPDLEAPPSLVPDVMAIIRQRERSAARAWYRRPATSWPPAAQIALGVGALLLVGLLMLAGHEAATAVRGSSETTFLASIADRLGVLWTAGRAVVEALVLAVRALWSPLFAAALAAIFLSYFTLLGLGSTLWRAALRPHSS